MTRGVKRRRSEGSTWTAALPTFAVVRSVVSLPSSTSSKREANSKSEAEVLYKIESRNASALRRGYPFPRYAFSRAAMSSLIMVIIESLARFDFALSRSAIIWNRTLGTICHRRP